jgi:hypothetical protein
MKNRPSEFENLKLVLGVNAVFASRRVIVNLAFAPNMRGRTKLFS